MTEENIDNEQSSDKKTDISTMNEQEMKEVLENMMKTAPNDSIKKAIQIQINKIKNK